MDNSIYIALSRQTAQFRKMDMTANNIANTDTVGFQSEHMVFTDYIVDNDRRGKVKNAFTQDIASYRDPKNGPIKATGNALDVAINGDGYFVVETPQGNRYTRAGNFQLDGNGVLITPAGYPVLNEGGQRIEFAVEDRDIEIGEAGNIKVNGEDRGNLGVVEFENPQFMTQVSDNLLKTDQAPLPALNSRVAHGALENSNVVGVTEVVELVKLQRSVSSTAKFIEVMYDLQRKANNVYSQQSG